MISAYCSGTFNAYPLVPLENGARCGNNPKDRRCVVRIRSAHNKMKTAIMARDAPSCGDLTPKAKMIVRPSAYARVARCIDNPLRARWKPPQKAGAEFGCYSRVTATAPPASAAFQPSFSADHASDCKPRNPECALPWLPPLNNVITLIV